LKVRKATTFCRLPLLFAADASCSPLGFSCRPQLNLALKFEKRFLYFVEFTGELFNPMLGPDLIAFAVNL
jgi:hypothetical protein